jgi:capsular polysaccharide biosynthesis protein
MDLAEIFRVMRRRWYVLLPGLLLTAVLAGGAYATVAKTYSSQSTVMLLNSEKATQEFDGNPFLSTQTSLTGMADSLARNLNSDTSVSDLREQGATGTTNAKIADNALGPLMWLTATGTDPDQVLRTDKLLASYAEKRLDQLQDDQSVKTEAKIRMTVIVPPQTPTAAVKSRTEYLVMAVLVGIVISLTATFWAEARARGAGSGRRHAAGRGTEGGGAAGAAGAAAGPDAPGASVAGAARSGSESHVAAPRSAAAPPDALRATTAPDPEPLRSRPSRGTPRWSVPAGGDDAADDPRRGAAPGAGTHPNGIRPGGGYDGPAGRGGDASDPAAPDGSADDLADPARAASDTADRSVHGADPAGRPGDLPAAGPADGTPLPEPRTSRFV